MSREKLRGATRRDFIRGAFAMGAALGWGPTRILEFLDRGGGLAHGIGEKAMNLLVITGVDGSGGHFNNLVPPPDPFVGTDALAVTGARYAQRMPVHFLQPDSGGGTVSTLGGAYLGRVNNYAATNSMVGLPAIPDAGGGLGAWAAGERFKRLKGSANMAFRGFTSTNSTSSGIDKTIYGSTTVPSNTKATPADNFIVYSRETPFQKYGLKKAFTQIDGGPISVHATGSENHWIKYKTKDTSWSIMGAAAAVQQEVRPAVLQAMVVGNMAGGLLHSTSRGYYGAMGPEPALVPTAAAMVGLFASNAVRTGGALVAQKNAALYEAFYKGMLGTQKSAVLPTYFRANQTTKLASNLIGVNLADKLTPTDADKRRYGFTGNNPNTITEFRDRLIVAEKAFKLGLSTTICLGMVGDDIHGLFTNSGAAPAAQAAAAYGGFLDAFMEGLMTDESGARVPDPFHPELTLGDNTVIVLVQDNLRNQYDNGGWPDDSGGGSNPINQNRARIMGNGFLQIGAFGGERPTGPGQGSEVGFFDAMTGDMLTPAAATSQYTSFTGGNQANTIRMYGEMSMAAALYAVTRGNLRRVNDFYSGPDFPILRVAQLL